jgi:hypothetical protein
MTSQDQPVFQPPGIEKKSYPFGLRTIMELFDVGPGIAITVLTISLVIVLFAVSYFVRSAPPTTITISTGPEGSVFQSNAQKYAKILERNGVKLKILTSNGSFENLDRLSDPSAHVDVGFVQGGLTNSSAEDLVSLGSVSYLPLLTFYRGKPIELLSQLAGKRVAIGPVGSGTRKLALSILGGNGIKEGGTTTLLDWEADQAAQAILDKKIDAAFIMSETASVEILGKLLHSTEAHLYNYDQAAAYTRKIEFMNILDLPKGMIDLGLNVPPHDISLIGPMVELIAKKNLHPALSDLLLEAAVEVHGRPGVFQRRGDFPTPVEHAIRISDDASRFYKSGKSLLYRYLPFWLASLLSRIVVVFIPMLVVLIPVMRSIPAFFRWRAQVRIRRHYRELLSLEQKYLNEKDVGKLDGLRHEFDAIEEKVNRMKVRAAFADQFYGLRGHIAYVRELVSGE